MSALVIESVEVFDSSLEARVRVTDARFLRTSASPEVARRVVDLLPGLVRHRCDSGHRRGALWEFADTETPHLLEHVTVELMALAGSPRSLKGETSWDFARDGHGVFRLAIEFDDDLVALAALKEANVIVEWLLTPDGTLPNVQAAVRRIDDARV